METESPSLQSPENGSKNRLTRIVSNLVGTITGKKAREQRTQESLQRSVEAEKFILGGIDQIREGRYPEAVGYFRNREIAKHLGVSFLDATHSIVNKTPSPEDVNGILQTIGWYSHGGGSTNQKGEKEGPIIVKIAGVITTDDSIKLPEVVYQYWALTSAEEWLHVLQALKARPIAGFKDPELDVMAYFVKQGLRLEDMPEIEFTRRWRSRETLAQRLLKPDYPI